MSMFGHTLGRSDRVRARTLAFGLIGIHMVNMVYGCKRGLE